MACDPQALIDSSPFVGMLPGDMAIAKLALLVRILKARDPAYVLNVNQLTLDAGCLQCLVGFPGMLEMAKLALLCRILEAQT